MMIRIVKCLPGTRVSWIRHLVSIAMAGAVVLTSCQTTNPFSRESRVDRYLRKHPALTAEVRQGIESGQLVKGMTPDEVKLIWESPTRREPSGQKGVRFETWIYEEELSSDDRGPASALYDLTVPIAALTFKGEGRSLVLDEWIVYTDEKKAEPAAPAAPAPATPAAPRIRTTPGVDLSRWPSLSVTGVAVSGGRRCAFINNTPVTPGELINGVTVIEVTGEGVYLRYEEETVFVFKGRHTGTPPKATSSKRKSAFW